MKFLSTTLALLVVVSPLLGKKSDKLEVERVASIQISAGSLNYPEKRNLVDATERVFDKAGFEMEDENGFLDPSSRREIKQFFVHNDYPADSIRVELRLKNTGLDVYFDSNTTFPHSSMVELIEELESRVKSRLPSSRIRKRIAKPWDDSAVAMAAAQPTEPAQPESNWLTDIQDAPPAQSVPMEMPEEVPVPVEEPVAEPVVAGDLDNIDLDALERQMAELTGTAEPATPTAPSTTQSSDISDKVAELRARRNAQANQQQSETTAEIKSKISEIRSNRASESTQAAEVPTQEQPQDSSKLNDLDWGF